MHCKYFIAFPKTIKFYKNCIDFEIFSSYYFSVKLVFKVNFPMFTVIWTYIFKIYLLGVCGWKLLIVFLITSNKIILTRRMLLRDKRLQMSTRLTTFWCNLTWVLSTTHKPWNSFVSIQWRNLNKLGKNLKTANGKFR